jgi:hypothetical protein
MFSLSLPELLAVGAGAVVLGVVALVNSPRHQRRV